MPRQFDTPEGLAAMKWELTRACIDLAIRDAVLETGTDRCLYGSPESGYWFALDHGRSAPHQPDLVPEDLRSAMVHYRLPPVTRNRASVEPAVLEDYLGDPVRTFDPWGASDGGGFRLQGLYASWVDTVEHAFSGSAKPPDERPLGGSVRDARGCRARRPAATRALRAVVE
jgi:hypothetical protein